MKENKFKNFFTPGPRGKLRWSVFAIAVLFVAMLFVNLIGSNNIVTKVLDNILSKTPVVDNLKIWPQIEVNQSDGTKNLKFKNIRDIDLVTYGFPFKLGLDLRGGAHLVYEADVSQISSTERSNALSGVRDVIERRVNAFGVSEPIIQTNQVGDKWRVIVELAGVTDINEAIRLIGETPLLEFKEENPTASQLTVDQQAELDKLNIEVRDKAQSVLDQILAGGDFAKLAQENSEDEGSKDNGGFYTGVKKGTFVPEYEEVLFNKLKSGEVYSQLVQSQFGYHIIKKETVSGEGEDLAIDTRHILFKTKTATDIGVVLEPDWKTTTLTGKQLKRASVELAPNSGVPQVSLEFDSEGADLFAELTKKNAGKLLAIFLDGQPISIPRVNEPILSGQAVISGSFTLQDAKLLAQRLNAGALPVPIELISQTTVGATLGNDSVQKSLVAGFWGLILVAIFMILYYRLPGLLAVKALLIYTVIILALFKLIPVTLTLAGIAGFILSIGMAVDANVLIFERLKEELRAGRDLTTAVEQGFRRAWSSIRDSNISSLITCAILFWFGSSIIKGFALTLAIGTLVSMFSAITITRQVLRLIAKWKISHGDWLYGVKIK
ncbi:protein translocase subunit SecD [Candidatus Falkowbacteria bacterium]|uniref:Protein translocase subunit SecD n=1 Tax=Candidatus Buchananbacteria bacterium CG10_big_fil_rev_8_21_14_0_10_33_19 TaxID=1974525 RepID=A0A2H0W5P6_9BACT|nr:protein translocase subunit SecD [Candidatus Falkowbacteria bacterium]PIS05931.1 MAG: protein translocase subunit SecD [Candidatus Buchananbacteria bacterium CG10_big_fil_rev_8_21_14_0_10_33_19]